MRTGSRWCVALIVVLVMSGTARCGDATVVPLGSVPTLDGWLAGGEWADAHAIPLEGPSMLFLKHADGWLFLAFQAPAMGIPSPLIGREGEVRVLHASAALGTAVYTHDRAMWSLSRGFAWHCRITGFSASAVAERDRFLEREGWLGTIVGLGSPAQFEFQIAWDGSPLRMMFLFLEPADPLRLISWPLDEDAVRGLEPILTGPLPDAPALEPGQWALLSPGP